MQQILDVLRRGQLLVHTEQDAGSRQCSDTGGDQVCRREHPTWNDHTSTGARSAS